MARRGLWVIGGLAVGVGALVLRPDTRIWLRRRLGLEAEDRRWFEDENGEPAEHEGDEPLDTREARFSLRARLAEEGIGEQAPAAAAEAVAEEAPFAPPPPPPPPAAPAAPISYAPPVAPPVVTPLPEPEPVREPDVEPEPAAALPEEPAAPAPAPTWTPPPAPPPPAPVAPAPEPVVESPEPEYLSYEAVPAVRPEADAPKTPGEDTNEIEPLPPVSSWEPPPAPPPAAAPPPPAAPAWQPPAAASPAPPPPPIELRPSTPPPAPAPRPFSSEGASFRSAIDAARERVHGSAREATPEDGEANESDDERS